MNIEKVKNYNQFMLSIIVTAGVAFAVIGLISFIFFLLTDVFNVFRNRNNYNSEDYSNKNYFSSDTKNESFSNYYGFPELADSTNLIYLIPIGLQTNYEVQNRYSSEISSISPDSYQKYNKDDRYRNIILFNSKTDESELLFKKEVEILQYGIETGKDDILAIFEVVDKDTDKDGKLNSLDQSSFFVYSFHEKQLKQAKFSDKSVLKFDLIYGTNDFLIRFGSKDIYRNENTSGKTNETILCKYTFATDKLSIINNEQLLKELNTISGKK